MYKNSQSLTLITMTREQLRGKYWVKETLINEILTHCKTQDTSWMKRVVEKMYHTDTHKSFHFNGYRLQGFIILDEFVGFRVPDGDVFTNAYIDEALCLSITIEYEIELTFKELLEKLNG